jgi:hypothetical protein
VLGGRLWPTSVARRRYGQRRRTRVVLTIEKPAVGDGSAMGVAAEIVENLLRPAEGPLGVDHPLHLAQRLQMCGESRRVGEPPFLVRPPRWPEVEPERVLMRSTTS